LARHRRFALDTSIFIFQLEENAKYVALANQIFRWLNTEKVSAVTSAVTMLELLVQPYREEDPDGVDAFYALLSTYPNLRWVDVSLDIADQGARLRAEHNLKTADALQAATALLSQATGLVSNDPAFKRVENLEVVIFDDLLAAGK
jgi:predicted nucleic acid-binding protein